VQPSRFQELIGALTILLFGGFIGWVFLAGDLTWRPGLEFTVEFDRLGIIETGAQVRIGDQRVGFVRSISYSREKRGVKPKVRLRLWVDKKYASWLFDNSRFYFESISLIGQRHINVALPPAGEPLGAPVRAGQVLKGEPPAKLDRVLQKAHDTIVLALRTQKELRPEWQRASKALDNLRVWESFFDDEVLPSGRRIVDQTKKLTYPKGVDVIADETRAGHIMWKLYVIDALISGIEVKLKTTADQIDANLGIWDTGAIKSRINRLERRFTMMRDTVKSMRPMVTTLDRAINSSSGTVGALVRDRTIWDDIKMMARRLKNAPLDLLLKRREKLRN